MRKFLTIAILAFCTWLAIIFVRPYWDRHLLQMDIEEAAIYGTKRSEGEVRGFLANRMKEKGRNIKSENLLVDKNERNTVYVKMSYWDEVKLAGHTLKRVQFTLEARKTEMTNDF
jgi:hypothetical protein